MVVSINIPPCVSVENKPRGGTDSLGGVGLGFARSRQRKVRIYYVPVRMCGWKACLST